MLTAQERAAAIGRLESLPDRVEAAVAGLSDGQLDTPYREGGWTVRQVVHHLSDAHMSGVARMKMAVTVDRPVVSLYDQDAWSLLADAGIEVGPSLAILRGLHRRWAVFLRGLDAAAFARAVVHPERGELTVDAMLQIYAAHGDRHLEQIASLRRRMGW